MKISEITNSRLSNAVQYLIERFDDSKWLLKIIDRSALSQQNDNWDAKKFYTKILNDVIESKEFEKLFDDLVKVPIVPEVIVSNNTDYTSKVAVYSGLDFIKYFRWNKPVNSLIMILTVPKAKPNNLKNTCVQLESIIGHEITHIIQRLHRLKDEFYEPGELKKIIKRLKKQDAELSWINDTNYSVERLNRENIERNKEIIYYLRHGELIAYAYTIASKLSDSEDWKKDLVILYRYGWSEKYHILRGRVRNSAREYIIKYSEIIHQAERRGIIPKDNGKKIWNKLFKEIYRNLKNTDE